LVEEGMDRIVPDKSSFLENVIAQYLYVQRALAMGGRWHSAFRFGGFFTVGPIWH